MADYIEIVIETGDDSERARLTREVPFDGLFGDIIQNTVDLAISAGMFFDGVEQTTVTATVFREPNLCGCGHCRPKSLIVFDQ